MPSSTKSIEEKVIDESRRFRAALPRLLLKYRDKWIVFKDGNVAGAFDEEDIALDAAVRMYGRRGGGFIIVQVTETAADPVPISAALFLVSSGS